MFPVMNTVILASTVIFLKRHQSAYLGKGLAKHRKQIYLSVFMSMSANGVEVYVSIKIISAKKK